MIELSEEEGNSEFVWGRTAQFPTVNMEVPVTLQRINLALDSDAPKSARQRRVGHKR